MSSLFEPDQSPSYDGQTAEQVAQLRQQLIDADRLYREGKPTGLTDAQWDEIYRKLQQLEDEHPELKTADSPTQKVGGVLTDSFETVAHRVPMLSIDNVTDTTGLNQWHQRHVNALGNDEIDYVCEPKVDGIALSLRYEHGKLTAAVTRGDGEKGDLITANIVHSRAVPVLLENDPPEILEVRGEIFLPFAAFEQINTQRAAAGLDLFANPRNTTAGTLKQKDARKVIKGLRFFAYALGECSSSFETQHKMLMNFKQWGLPTCEHAQQCANIAEVENSIATLNDLRHQLEYATDGAVVKVNRIAKQTSLGTTSRAPRWCIAYKFPPDRATTVLREVAWQVDKTGRLTPRASMDPVLLAGTTVRHASLHNSDQITRLGLQIGDTVVIEKAGEIIPQVVSVSEPAANGKPLPIPFQCPSCSEPVTRIEGEADLRCDNPACPAQVREKLIWFCARDQMDIGSLGEKLIHQLCNSGLLSTFSDIYRLKDQRDTLVQLERMGDKKADNLLKGIEASKTRNLSHVLAGFGIRHIGNVAAETLCQSFHTLELLVEANCDDFSNIDGIGPATAESLYRFLHEHHGSKLLRDLQTLGLSLTEPITPKTSSRFTGKTVVLTGTLSMPRKQAQDALKQMGAKISSSVSKNTDYLIAGRDAGSKADKATSLGVTILSEDDLAQAIHHAK